MTRPFLLLLLITALAGCSAAPRLKVTDIQVTDRTEAGIVLKVSVEAENRNEVEVPLREIRYSVKVAGGQTFTGIRSAEASLRRLGTQSISFPAVIPLTAGTPAPSGLVNVEVSGTVAYLAPGNLSKALYDMGISRPRQSFAGAAAVNLSP